MASRRSRKDGRTTCLFFHLGRKIEIVLVGEGAEGCRRGRKREMEGGGGSEGGCVRKVGEGRWMVGEMGYWSVFFQALGI